MRLLEPRRNNVIAGLEAEGMKMESLKKLFLLFDKVSEPMLEVFRNLVDESVDSNLQQRCWEVEV